MLFDVCEFRTYVHNTNIPLKGDSYENINRLKKNNSIVLSRKTTNTQTFNLNQTKNEYELTKFSRCTKLSFI